MEQSVRAFTPNALPFLIHNRLYVTYNDSIPPVQVCSSFYEPARTSPH